MLKCWPNLKNLKILGFEWIIFLFHEKKIHQLALALRIAQLYEILQGGDDFAAWPCNNDYFRMELTFQLMKK